MEQPHVHDVTANWRRQGRLIALGQLLTIDQFRAADSQITYLEAGSFIRFLLDSQGGVPPVKALFSRATTHDAPAATRRNIESVYGKTLDMLETEWHVLLDAR